MRKHTILFLAANPQVTTNSDRHVLALEEEARAIREELERGGHRDRFEFATRWAVRPLDLLRELNRLRPSIVHFSGHGTGDDRAPDARLRRDITAEAAGGGVKAAQSGLYFLDSQGRPKLVPTEALQEAFGAAGSMVKLVVLNACYSDVQADALLAHVDCVVGMAGAILDAAAIAFACGFYGALGEGLSATVAYRQGCAAISMQGLADRHRPRLRVRDGMDTDRLVLSDLGTMVGTSSPRTPPVDGIETLPDPVARQAARELVRLAVDIGTGRIPPELHVQGTVHRVDRQLAADGGLVHHVEFLLEMIDTLEERIRFLAGQQEQHPMASYTNYFVIEHRKKTAELAQYRAQLRDNLASFLR